MIFESGGKILEVSGWGYSYVVQYFAPALVTGIDFALGARLRFRLVYMPLPQIFLAIHTIAGNMAPSHIIQGTWLFYLLRHIGLLIASLILIALSRISGCSCCRRPRQQEQGGDDQTGREV